MTIPTPPRVIDDPVLNNLHDLDALADYLKSHREALKCRIGGPAAGLELARAYSDLVDSIVRRMLALACEHTGRNVTVETVPIAVVATGGYGRRQLCPYSDIDITFIPHRDGDPLIDKIIKEMFTLVMRVFIDQCGIEVGYAYRLMQDCAVLDHQTITGLLDARLITGNDRLFIQFEHDFWSYFNPADFIFAKLEERRAQQIKAGNTPRIVEPNLKEGRGGMRDLQTAIWVTQARHSLTAARVRGERAWEILVRDGGVSEDEAARLKAGMEFLFRVRNALHVITGAERDQLVVTRQEEVAEALGYSDSSKAAGLGCAPPVERFMRDYYDHAAAIDRIAGDVMRRAENSRLFLGVGLDCKRRQVVPANLALGSEDPLWMLWACELAQKYDLTFSDDLERAVVDLVETEPIIKDNKQAGEVFTRILASSQGVYPILQKMADLGILGWLLPEVGSVLNLIPYDPSHDYTVGQHTLYLIRHLDSLRTADTGEEMRDYRMLMSELPHPEELYLAALLHDAGKGDEDRPHSEVGEEIADRVCRNLHWIESATANVKFLVRHHLLMAETSRLRDLNLDETVRDFTAIVDDLDRLHMLYLLTYADTNAVGAGIWTQVKGRFQRDLLRRAERTLAGEESDEFDDAVLTRTRRRLLKDLSVENLPEEEVTEHVEGMPATYLLNTTLEEIALHIGFVRKARTGVPVIDFHDERDSTFTELTVCTLDDPEPGLLAKITGVFYAVDLDVHSAQVFTRTTPRKQGDAQVSEQTSCDRIAIDNFFVDFRGRQLTPGKRKELATSLTAVLQGKMTVAELLTKKRRPVEIGGLVDGLVVRDDLSDNYRVVEVSSSDERAMLYRASGALSQLGWDIHSARVSHFKGKNVASFYIRNSGGLSIADARRQLQRIMPTNEGL
jgi:[protein-PII] uridylyltransferase